jgi:type III restriction enzyme
VSLKYLTNQDKNNNQRHYQFFIEPKGKYLQQVDKWKEDFLLEIEQNYKALTGIGSATTYSNNEYKNIGLEFYNHDNKNSFKDKLKSKLAIQ